jgi:hypothetical protein
MAKAQKSINKVSSQPSRAKSSGKRSANSSARKPSKSDAILALLRRKQGASLEEMQKATGWQAHSVRGYLSGTVKKRLGLKLNSTEGASGERRYLLPAV